MRDSEADDVAQLTVVQAAFDRGDEGDGQAVLGTCVQGGLLGRPQVPTSKRQMGGLGQPVELQVDVGPLGQGSQVVDELAVMSEPQSVGVEVEMADTLLGGEAQEVEDLRVDGRLAAGEHDHLRLTLRADKGVQASLDLVEGEREPVGLVAGVGEADRAVKVAAAVDFDDPQTGVLFVLRAQPAVERAAVDHLGLGFQRDGAGLVEPQRVHVHLRVGIQQRLERPVRRAAFAQEHLVVANVDLRVDDDLAHRADALGVLQEHLVPVDLLNGTLCRLGCGHAVPPGRDAGVGLGPDRWRPRHVASVRAGNPAAMTAIPPVASFVARTESLAAPVGPARLASRPPVAAPPVEGPRPSRLWRCWPPPPPRPERPTR